MGQQPYSYNRTISTRYHFLSTGREIIQKVVEFTPLIHHNLYNIGFGDLTATGKIDDKANSNNGDIIKVLSTVTHIIKDFTSENAGIKIVFAGSTKERTLLYQRIIRTYWRIFRKEFDITALEETENSPKEVNFDPNYKGNYLAFFIRRIN